MCGRYQLSLPLEEIESIFQASAQTSYAPRYNIAPTQSIPIIRAGPRGRDMVNVRWGLVPSWSQEGPIGQPLINARSETVSQKPSFRDAFRWGRCLVPATGFYEWQRKGRTKTPHLIRLKESPVFAMAGIGARWHGPNGPLESIAILTVDPAGALDGIHDRMPVILPESAYGQWLNPNASPTVLQQLCIPRSKDEITMIAVSERVNRVSNDDVGCERPAEIQDSLF